MAGSLFPTTRGSVVAALASENDRERARAFDTLSEIYWTPLFKYARVAHNRADAEDLTQAFLAVAFERETLATYDAQKASFRTFLRTLFDRYIANETRAASRLKRGGDLTRVDLDDIDATTVTGNPEETFQQEWTRSVFTVAIERLRTASDPIAFEMFEAYDVHGDVSYRDLASRFATNETTVTNKLAAVRRRFREIVLDLLREITASEQEFRSEARALLGVEL